MRRDAKQMQIVEHVSSKTKTLSCGETLLRALRKYSMMVITLNSITVITQLLVCILLRLVFFFTSNEDSSVLKLKFFGDFLFALRHAVNFFIFVAFDKTFKKACLRLFRFN